MSIQSNLTIIKAQIPENVKLIAVSKTKPAEIVLDAYNAGHRVFGENKAQEMSAKFVLLPKDIEWHFIGHLQTNKVKYIAPFAHMIHSVDSLKLLNEINKHGAANNKIINCLLQFHIAKEETKFGFDYEEADAMLNSSEFENLTNIRIAGLMGMATFTDNKDQVKKEFAMLRSYFEKLKANYYNSDPLFREISMGMSDDYQIAIQQGSTMVRIGTAIFGTR